MGPNERYSFDNKGFYSEAELRGIAAYYGIDKDTVKLQNKSRKLRGKRQLPSFTRLSRSDLIELIQSNGRYRSSEHAKKFGVPPIGDFEPEYDYDFTEREEEGKDSTIAERILDKAGNRTRSADWYAEELFGELSVNGEQRFPRIGEVCFFSYTAAFPENYKWYDTRPLAYIMDVQSDATGAKLFGANLHYLNPGIRGGVAGSLLNKVGATLPPKTIHSYFISNISNIYILPPNIQEYYGIAQLVTERFVSKRGLYVSPEMAWDTPND